MNVYKKLMQARIELQSRKLKKSGMNKFAVFEYFELADFLPAIQEIFNNLGLCGVISFGKEYAFLKIVDIEKPDSFIEISSPMAEAILKGCHPIQNLGASETYLRRYLWVTALEIVEHDALDATIGKGNGMNAKPLSGVAEEYKDKNPEDYEFLRGLAAELVQFVEIENNAHAAFDHLAGQHLDAEKNLALWAILAPNSKTRNEIKKEKEKRKKEMDMK